MRGVLRILAIMAVALAGRSPAHAERRVALAIGNSEYRFVGPLPNPIRDATAMADLLRKAGFDEARVISNVTAIELRRALRDFASLAENSDIAVIFYAGHGVEIGGKNYLVPVDARLATDLDADDEAIELDYLLARIEGAKRLKVIILDACRENPFRTVSKTRSIGRGLRAPEAAPSGTLIAFAAQPGAVAQDGNGEHSPYASALLHHLTAPGVEIEKALRRVRDDVLRASGRNRQEPWKNDSRSAEDVYFGPPPSIDAGQAEFETAMSSGTVAALDAFLATHPSGPLANTARRERKRLASQHLVASPPIISPAPSVAITPDPKVVQQHASLELTKPSADSATIPWSSYVGKWTTKASKCRERNDDYRVDVAAKSLSFVETDCRIVSLHAMGDGQTVKGSCSGEGEKWPETFKLQLDKDQMTMRSDRDKFRSSTKYVRCR